MPQYLYQIFPTRPAMLIDGLTEQEAAAMSQHFAYLTRLIEQGVVILAGRTQHTDVSSFGIVIYNAENNEQASEIMKNDPSIVQGVTRGVYYPYRIALIAPANVRDE